MQFMWYFHRGLCATYCVSNEQQIRQQPPLDMSLENWNKHVDFFMREDRVRKSVVNSENRRKQLYASTHGTKAYVEYRHDRHLKEGSYPTLVEGFGLHHTNKVGNYINSEAERRHLRMKELESDTANPKNDVQILEEVLGTRRGHNCGRGRVIPGSSSSSDSTAQSQSFGRVYTQVEVDTMMQAQRLEMEAFKSQQQAILHALESRGISVPFPTPQHPQYPSSSRPRSESTRSGDEDEVGDHDEEQV